MSGGILFRGIFDGGGISTLLSGIRISLIGDFGIGFWGGSCNVFGKSTFGCSGMIDVVCFIGACNIFV